MKGLIDNQCNVTKIQECLAIPQSTVSQHLVKLKAAGIIEGKKIAGSQVTKGKIKVGDQAIIKSQNREGKETKIASLKKFRKEVESASSGQECGIAFAENIDFNIGDIIESLG